MNWRKSNGYSSIPVRVHYRCVHRRLDPRALNQSPGSWVNEPLSFGPGCASAQGFDVRAAGPQGRRVDTRFARKNLARPQGESDATSL